MNGILMNGHDTEKGLCDVRLLVVDDDAFSRKLMLEILRKRGICVDVAGNGAEAVEKIGRADYAAVLMDCRMPVMDGFEATRKIRADRRFADLPILAMSGDATEDDVKKCLECGMNGCIAKPIDVGQLFTTLGHWIKFNQNNLFDISTPIPLPTSPLKGEGQSSLPLQGEGWDGGGFGRDGLNSVAVVGSNGVAAHGDEAPNIPGLETDKALRHLGGNVDLLRKLIIRFGATQADTVTHIRAAIESGDAETALRAAHTFKGVAGNIGATQMSACAAMVESMLKQGKADGLADALDEMEQELNLLRERIAAAMSGYEPPAGAAPGSFVDMAALAGELREFAALLATGDSRACKLVDGIAYRLGAVGQNIAASQLKEFISQYDFKGALDKLKEAAQALDIAL